MKKKILIVDDELNVTTFLKTFLEQTGKFEVKTENLGERGLEVARTFQPDLMLLDIMMNDMGGDRIADTAKNDPMLRKIPIVFMTGIVTKEEVDKNQGRIGGYAYIAKPILAMSQLLECIENHIG